MKWNERFLRLQQLTDETIPPGENWMNHVIIKIESGVVADVYSTEPVNVTIVDHDVIEGGEPFEARMKKAVLSMTPDQRVMPADVEQIVKNLVLDCRRPLDGRHSAWLNAIDEAAA
jgi:hypothetical protein